MKVRSAMRRALWGLLLSMLAVPLVGGCAEEKARTRYTKGTSAVIEISADGKITLRDATGKELPPCQLCDQEAEKKYGPGCAKAESTTICTGTTRATLQDLTPLLLLRSHKNPYCQTYYVAGRYYQGPCFCYPGEVEPAGINCVNQ